MSQDQASVLPMTLAEGSTEPSTLIPKTYDEDTLQDDGEESETLSMSLPPVLTNPSLEGTGAEGWTLELYKQTCFKCTGLNPEGEKRWQRMPCNSERGNLNCPVGQITIKLVGVRKKLLRQVKDAQATGRPLDLIEVLDHLRKTANEDDQRWVMEQAGLMTPSATAVDPVDAVGSPESDAGEPEGDAGITLNDGGFPVAP